MAGYSGTPLVRKLGIREGQRALLIGVPDSIAPVMTGETFAWLERMPAWRDLAGDMPPLDYVHLFTKERAVLEAALPVLRCALEPAGMIWVSWPKRAAKVPTDVTEDGVREIALSGDLVDVKVCAVDEIWSGLKLVVRRTRR